MSSPAPVHPRPARGALKLLVLVLGAYGVPSPHVEPVIRALRELGYEAEVRRVPYEFLRGGDEMLTVSGP